MLTTESKRLNTEELFSGIPAPYLGFVHSLLCFIHRHLPECLSPENEADVFLQYIYKNTERSFVEIIKISNPPEMVNEWQNIFLTTIKGLTRRSARDFLQSKNLLRVYNSRDGI